MTINYYILYYIINILEMLSKADKYRKIIQDATKRIILFPHQEKQSTVTFQCNRKLPASYPFRSSQQIENNVPLIHNITHQSSKQYPTSLHNEWPKSCIGLILCEHYQNSQTFYVYGTGTLIHEKIVLTSAQNVYCRRLNKQYTNIRFIVGVNNDKCSGIYDTNRVDYPKEYTMQKYDNYNFAVLQLYDDLSNSCGYIGWKTIGNIKVDEKLIAYGYTCNKEGTFNLRVRTKHQKQQQEQEYYQGSEVLIKENKNNYYIVGLQHLKRKHFLSDKIRNIINLWTEFTSIDASYKNIDAQGCRYLSQAKWTHLARINLGNNNINPQGCKYLSQANWIHLTRIDLYNNKIGAQGCKYLSQANWIHLTIIWLDDNMIGAQGCKYLSQANWIHLTTNFLGNNNIGIQGCRYLSQANYTHLTRINLIYNNIGAQGCKYLSKSNWPFLTNIYLNNDDIQNIVYRLLLLDLYPNNIMI